MPEVSVIMPIYNGVNYMEHSIRSVLAQSLPDFELLIIDDASTDRTAEVVRSFEDPRISLTQASENRGLFYNLNRLIERSSSPLVKLWSHDDIMLPSCLERGVQFFRKHPELGYFYSNCDYIGTCGELIGTPPYDVTPIVLPQETADRYCLLHGCISGNIANLWFPRAIFAEVGDFKHDWIAADFDLMVRIQEKHPIGRIDDILVHLRRHDKQWSSAPASFLKFFREDLQIYEELTRRLVHVHRSMTEREIREIKRKKLAHNYFHGAVRRLGQGKLTPSIELVRRLGVSESAVLAWLWLRGLPERVKSS